MTKKKTLNKVEWIFIYLLILFNFVLLLKLKKESVYEKPLEFLEINKPALVLLLDEFECASCIESLKFLNNLYHSIEAEGKIEFQGIILSGNNTDRKGISRAFDFPFSVSDNFQILGRLNMNRTPLIIGLSREHRVLYSELVPFETSVTETYIRKGVLDRLYYSLGVPEEKGGGY